jgi:hypothetical protein
VGAKPGGRRAIGWEDNPVAIESGSPGCRFLGRFQKEPNLGDQGIGLGEKSSDIVQPCRPFKQGPVLREGTGPFAFRPANFFGINALAGLQAEVGWS